MKTKKSLMLALGALLCASTLFAQSRKVEQDTYKWRYELQAAVGQASQGTTIVRVWTYARNPNLATAQAAKNAVHGIMFKGFPGQNGIVGRAPIIDDPNVETQNAAYFDNFFKDSGLFQRYVSFVGNGVPDQVIKVGKEYKIGIVVVVQIDQLRKRLEDDGIIKSLGTVLTGKKPTIMVVPSNVWCNQHGYMTKYDNLGKTEYVPDYEKALASDPDLLLAISKMNELMAREGFPLKNLESSLKTLKNQSAEDAMLASKQGAEVAESPIDKLKKTAKADIWLQLTWSINSLKGGSQKSLTFNLQALDAYTDKQVAGSSGTGNPTYSSTVEIPILVEEAIQGHIRPFCDQLMDYFTTLEKTGREMVLRIKVWDDFEDGLEYEVDGRELSEIIEEWVTENTVNGSFNLSDATENMMLFEQVRIPLKNEKGRDLDARSWARDLQKLLRDNYGIDAKLMMQGLGQAQLVIGGK